MRKPARLALFAPAAIAAALLALSSDRGPLRAREAQAAVDPQKDKNYDLASLDVFRKTIVQIKDNYVDPSRINPKEMFTASLEAVERQVAEVMVEVGGPPCDDRAVNREPGTSMIGAANSAQQGGILEANRAQVAGCGHANASIPENHVRVKKGDVITQIDNDSTVSMELQEAVDRMRGKPGTKVSIWVAHKGAEPKRLDLTRALVTYETVVSKLLDNGVGYVRLSGFSGTTTRDMIAAIRSMKQQNGGALRRLVLDMRGNPGGLLEQAIQVSDAFVEEGTIVTTVGVNGTLREPKLARADGGEREVPLARLISTESASASEIVAAARKKPNPAPVAGGRGLPEGPGA